MIEFLQFCLILSAVHVSKEASTRFEGFWYVSMNAIILAIEDK